MAQVGENLVAASGHDGNAQGEMMPKYLVMDPGEADRNSDGRISATELSVSALWLGLFAAGFLLGLLGLFGSWRVPLGPFRLVLFLVDLALTGACIVGCWRHYAVFDRALRWAAADRARVQRLEDEDRKLRTATHDSGGERIGQTDIDAAAKAILGAYFKKKPWQRGKIPGISDTRWGLANDALKASGLRNERANRINADSMADAWAKYVDWTIESRTWKRINEEEFVKG